MKILITGNPKYEGLAQGLAKVLVDYDITFISRNNGYDLTDVQTITEIAKDYDVFINNTNIPNDGQLKLLDSVYNSWSEGLIINVSTTSVYWDNKKNIDYYNSKLKLEQRSKELSSKSAEHGNKIRVSCIAFGELNTESQRSRQDGRNKMLLTDAAQYVKILIDSPKTININYICLDPKQKEI